MLKNPVISYYISAHGYGHGVRSCDIIRALVRIRPDVRIFVTTDLPVSFLKNRLMSDRVFFRSGAFDVGMVQLDSIRVNVDATLDKLDWLYDRKKELIQRETRFLEDQNVNLVISDIPGIPIEAAKYIYLPALAVGNFSWDWIYSAFVERNERWSIYVDEFRDAYSRTNLLLRLPFHGDMSAFPVIEDVPVLASPGRNSRGDISAMTGCSADKKWILLSFTTLDWNEKVLARVEQLSDYEFFTVKPLEWKRTNIHPIDRERISFSDIVASVDAVITKPGFGIISDCVVNRTPMIYADRPDFLEYPILADAIQKYLKNVHIPAEQLYQGELSASLQAIGNSPEPSQKIASGGDGVAALRIAQFI